MKKRICSPGAARVGLYLTAISLAVLHFVACTNNVIWGDEGYSIRLAKMSFPEMLQATAADVHPPLHYILMQILYRIFGEHPLAYHMAGYLPYVLLLLFLSRWFAGKRERLRHFWRCCSLR